jgi:hypothetical protein
VSARGRYQVFGPYQREQRRELKEIMMRPDHDLRRKVIREWMLLPRDRRKTHEQAAAFATRIVQANAIGRGREDPHQRVMAWLSPRIGKT